ncbi:OLC1v1031674C1 [Oldenlandia corymbosa var. corymbosa]|uniref:OLC1v1031674C1 n=1 Tax=Oldenlandia corymbosa var. corymbosa TaxID=529605 RepID=A0AAV1CKU8_OLDCO|nr:OLC1v1031674C1 [Oldenlandia corymbosa var. corymbosa]
MGSSDSLSFPSEPPDVANWFSSYAYESPALDSADDFKDWRCSVVAETGDGKKGKRKDFSEFPATRKRGVSLEKTTLNEVITWKSLMGPGNCSSEVPENADSLSQFSEPLDVKNWFSSYVYESPALDTCCELRSQDGDNHAPNSITQKKEEPINITKVIELGDFGVQNFSSDELNRHTNSHGERKSHQHHFVKDSQKGHRNKYLALQILDKEKCPENGIDFGKDVEKSNSSGSSPGNFNTKVETEPTHLLFDVTRMSRSQEQTLPRKLFERSDPTNEIFKPEAFAGGMDSIGHAENLNLKMGDKGPLNKVAGGHTNKENDGNECAESGFISTRKSKQAEGVNSFRKPIEDKVDHPTKENKEVTDTRKVLLETTNFQVPQVIGITGKWKCPQKSQQWLKKNSTSLQLLSHLKQNASQQWRFQSIRTLILQSASDSVKLQKLSDSDSGIVEVNLDRPAAKNAINKEMLYGLQDTLETVYRDPSANVLMICSSVHKAFCAGADLKERKTMTASEVQDFVNSLRSTFSFLEGLHIPTIAVVEGAALGGGMEMALSCDLRICGEDALFGLPETGLAIIPGAGGTQRLPRLVGKSIAKDIIFSGRSIGGRDAASIGLVNYCVPAGEARIKALEIARNINQKGPLAIKMAKQAIDGGVERDLTSALSWEMDCYEKLLYTKDRLEGLAAFAEKRKPVYKGE